MSGPEWTPEHDDAPAEGRPLGGPPGAEGPTPPSPQPVMGRNPFGIERPRPADLDRVAREDAAAQANLQADHLGDDEAKAEATDRPSKLAGVVAMIHSLVVRLVNRRRTEPDHEDDTTAVGPRPDPTDPVEDPDHDPAPEPEPGAPRLPWWSPAGWTWETRVGMAAVLSFLILVGVFVGKRWGGQGEGNKPPVTALSNPDSPDIAKKSPDHAEKSPAQESSTTPPVATVADGSKPPEQQTGSNAEPHPAPAGAPVDGAVTLKGDTTPQPPQVTPPTADDTLVAGSLLANASAGDPNKPVPMPGPSTDAPVLPPGELAVAGLPAMPGQEEAKPGPEVRPADPTPTPGPEVATTEPKPPEVTAAAEATSPGGLPEPAAVTPPAGELPVAVAEAPVPSPPAGATTNPAPPVVAVTPTPPAVEEPPAMPATPLQPVSPRGLEAIPSSASEAPAASKGVGWVVIPSSGKRPGTSPTSDPGTDGGMGTSAGGGSTDVAATRPGRSRMADPLPDRADPAAEVAQHGSVLHTVQADENFWTISKQYYNSGRYYKALYQANAGQVPDITKLYVGTVIRIPPPEALNRALVEPPVLGAAIDGSAVSRTSSSSSKGADPGVGDPPARSTRPGLAHRARSEPVEAPRKQTYRVKANDTLRSIARDTLEDSRRSSEIYNLNRDLLDDPKSPLAPGTTLTLPEDAVIGRRSR